MDTALKQGGTDPALADQTWSKVDREVTDQAPMVELFTPKMIDFVSKRVGNYVWNLQWYMLMSQLSVN
jgi:peptide/nickel transport system substrate-binding protein